VATIQPMTSQPQFQFQPGNDEQDGAASGVSEMPVQTRLNLIHGSSLQDMVIGPPAKLPLFEGLEDESLVCPGCEGEVTRGVSALTLHALFQPPGRLLFHCNCDAYGEVIRPESSDGPVGLCLSPRPR
jgi:hypothetical protein